MVPIFYWNYETDKYHVFLCDKLTYRKVNTNWMDNPKLKGDNYLLDVDVALKEECFDSLEECLLWVTKELNKWAGITM